MKRQILSLAALAVVASISSVAHAQANGPAPTLNIVSPTAAGGTIYLGSFPATQPISYTVQMNGIYQNGGAVELKSLGNLNVRVNGSSLYGTDDGLNAFSNTNACTGTAAASPNTCSTGGATSASLTVPWHITGVGEYTIVVSGKYRGDTGEDIETVTVATLSAEYPAPPAVANAYINSGAAGQMSGKQRGCVISKIADQHAKNSAYGPKGGPYRDAEIQAAVISFVSSCPR